MTLSRCNITAQSRSLRAHHEIRFNTYHCISISVVAFAQNLEFRHSFIVLLLGKERSIAMTVSVCMSAREHITRTARPIFT